MKTLRTTTLFCATVLIIFLVACKKEYQVINHSAANNSCPKKYITNTRPYVNPYFGPIPNTPFSPQTIYLEKYLYSKPAVNPNNRYEICYCREEADIHDKDLYKYNFCTGKTTLIATNISSDPNWSIKDWIIYTGDNGDIYKVKSNGDSLTRLTALGTYQSGPKWNPSGTKFVWNFSSIADENGKVIANWPGQGAALGWYDDNHILYSDVSTYEIIKRNINSNDVEYFAPLIAGINFYDNKKNQFYGVLYDSVYNRFQNIIFDVATNKTHPLSDTFVAISFVTGMYGLLDNKILLRQVLQDTATGSWTTMYSRVHIAIMDMDGSNIRQVILPE